MDKISLLKMREETRKVLSPIQSRSWRERMTPLSIRWPTAGSRTSRQTSYPNMRGLHASP